MKNHLFYLHYKVICFFIWLSIEFASTCAAQESKEEFVSGELIVQLNEGITPLELIINFKSIELNLKSEISQRLNLYCFYFSTDNIDNSGALNLIQKSNLVRSIQNNHYVVFNSIPNDVLYNQQWAMQKIEAPNAWDIFTGGNTVQNDEVVIAILDSGFDLDHEDINYWKNSAEIPDNGIDDDGNGVIDDYHGYNAYDHNGIVPLTNEHGTNVAGIAGARGNNLFGITGINWNVKIMPIAASSQTEEVVLRGYDYILDMRELYNETNGAEGAFVVVTNASFSTIPSALNTPENFPYWCQIYDALGAEGILNVNAPYNRGHAIADLNNNSEIPATCESEFLVVVTATDENDELVVNPDPLDNRESPWGVDYVDIAAPGKNILTTNPGNSYVMLELAGTSMAAPFVSGAISLLYANACNEFLQNYKANPSIYALEIRDLIYDYSDYVPSLAGKTRHGRLNLFRSLRQMRQQYDFDFTVTGIESESRQYEVINRIDVNNYNSTNQFNVNFIAGEEINFNGETGLVPGINKCITASIEQTAFDCAIPFEPLEVNLIAPTNSPCNFLGIQCHAETWGGKPPYNFIWSARTINESEFAIFNPNTPNMLFTFVEDFEVQVEVIDDRGISINSEVKFINCLLQRIGRDTDSLVHDNHLEIMKPSLSLDSNQLAQNHFIVYPNPANTIINVTAILSKKSDLTILLYDVTGKLISEFIRNRHYESGTYDHTFNISDYESGIYFLRVLSEKEIKNYKFTKSE
ncbi:MAG: S8/S53 family peptidase [Bacteroidia bacterium]